MESEPRTHLRLLEQLVQRIRAPLLVHPRTGVHLARNLELVGLAVPPGPSKQLELVSSGVGREGEFGDRDFDGDFAGCRVLLALVMLVSDFDDLGRGGLNEALAEGDYSA